MVLLPYDEGCCPTVMCPTPTVYCNIFTTPGAQPRLRRWGSNSLVQGITTLLLKEIRQVYPVWSSRLHNHTLFIKKLRKKLGGSVQILGGGGPEPPTPQWLHPCTTLLIYSKTRWCVRHTWDLVQSTGRQTELAHKCELSPPTSQQRLTRYSQSNNS